MAEKAIEEQMKELQSICDPIIASVYQAQGSQYGTDDDDEEFEDLWRIMQNNMIWYSLLVLTNSEAKKIVQKSIGRSLTSLDVLA